jgi:hypothetical protein
MNEILNSSQASNFKMRNYPGLSSTRINNQEYKKPLLSSQQQSAFKLFKKIEAPTQSLASKLLVLESIQVKNKNTETKKEDTTFNNSIVNLKSNLVDWDEL